MSRLLLKTLSQTSSSLPILDTLRAQLASLRRHLLRRLDQRLANLDSSHERLVEAICAFCLATSSSSSDALRHYHHLRLQEIRRLLELEDSEHHTVLQALRYYIKSLQTTKFLLGRSLSDTLKSLGTQPILHDPVVYALDELDLRTLQRWVAVDIQGFVPFIKHNDLEGPGTPSATDSWSREAFAVFSKVLKNRVKDVQSTVDLLELRRALLEAWLPVCFSTPVHSSTEILETLRNILNARVNELISVEALALMDVGTEITGLLKEAQKVTRAERSVWDATFVTMTAGKGAATFKQQLRMRHLGTLEGVTQILCSLDTWIAKVRGTRAVIEQLGKVRWQDHVEEDEEDEESLTKIEHLLQSDDPKLYAGEQLSNIARALSDFQLKIGTSATALSAGSSCDQVQSLLRIIREASQRLGQAFPEADLTTLSEIAPLLQSRLGTAVASQLLTFSKSRSTARRLHYRASTHLWEGDPPLPIQPSAHIFSLLRKLQEVMAELGGDLWTPAATTALKKVVSERLAQHDLFNLDAGVPDEKDVNGSTSDVAMTNGDTTNLPSATRLSRAQDLFDVLYLNYALAPERGDDVHGLAGTVQKLTTLSELDGSHAKAVSRRAKDYWERTNLLFGLLA